MMMMTLWTDSGMVTGHQVCFQHTSSTWREKREGLRCSSSRGGSARSEAHRHRNLRRRHPYRRHLHRHFHDHSHCLHHHHIWNWLTSSLPSSFPKRTYCCCRCTSSTYLLSTDPTDLSKDCSIARWQQSHHQMYQSHFHINLVISLWNMNTEMR